MSGGDDRNAPASDPSAAPAAVQYKFSHVTTQRYLPTPGEIAQHRLFDLPVITNAYDNSTHPHLDGGFVLGIEGRLAASYQTDNVLITREETPLATPLVMSAIHRAA